MRKLWLGALVLGGWMIVEGLMLVDGSAEVFAQDQQVSGEQKETQSQLMQQKPDKNPPMSVRERRRRALKFCKTYEGKLLAYYNDTFRVRGCKRLPVSYDELNEALKKGEQVEKVSAEVIYAIPLKKTSTSPAKKEVPRCEQLEGAYVTADNETVYLVENCRRRLFSSWRAYTQHRFVRGVQKSRLMFLEPEVLEGFKKGKPMPPGEDQVAKKALTQDQEKKLSRKEVCRQLAGKFIAYFSLIYKVESCRKRPVNALEFSRLSTQAAVGLSEEQKELLPKVEKVSTQQWVNLPIGKSYGLSKNDFRLPQAKEEEEKSSSAQKEPEDSSVPQKPAVVEETKPVTGESVEKKGASAP